MATDTGLDVTDYMVKLAYAPVNSAHSVELKLQKAEQQSNQSYLGLTDVDFAQDAYRRYGLSALDNIETDHEQAILRYRFKLSDRLAFSATAYNNEHARNWFKTEGIDLDGSNNAQDFSRISWANIVEAVNLGAKQVDFSAMQLQAILDGRLNTAVGSIQLRSNAREYYSRGLQLKLDWQTKLLGVNHQLEFGLRYHQDQEDRLQRNSTYQQLNGELVLSDIGQLGNAGNRVQTAAASALYVYDRIEIGEWLLTPGFRYENINLSRTRYSGGLARTFRDGRH